MTSLKDLRLYTTEAHDCSYLPSERAKTLFLDPEFKIDLKFHTHLSDIGFRRSGSHMYRPHCDNCKKCIPCRVLVKEFTAKKRFRRIQAKNTDLSVERVTTINNNECFELYSQYIDTRHKDGDMYPATKKQYRSFLVNGSETTVFYTIRDQGKLLAVMICDLLENGMSAVFTFYDVFESKRSLGNFGILWQIQEANRLGLDYLYLGYYIKDCGKMNYKTQYRPIELQYEQKWRRLD